MEHKRICTVGEKWVADLMALSVTQDILPLLTPDNIQMGEQGIELKNKNAQGLQLYLYSGYSAPEIYQGQPSAASSVYFAGAVLYALYTGAVPPDGPPRMQANTLLMAQTDPVATVINRATMPYQSQRIGSLQQLYQELHEAGVSIEQAAAPQLAEEPKTQAAEPVTEEKPKAEESAPVQELVAQKADENKESTETTIPAVQSEAGRPQETSEETPALAAAVAEVIKAEDKPAADALAKEPVIPAQTSPNGAGPATTEPLSAVSAPVSVPEVPKTEPAAINAAVGESPGQPAAMPYIPDQPPAAQNDTSFGYGAGQPVGDTQFAPAAPVVPAVPKKKAVSKKTLIAVIVTVAVLVIAAVVYTLVQSNRIDNAFTEGEYNTVVSAVDMTPWLKNSKQQQYDYSRAYLLMEEGKIEESLDIFLELGSYEDSPKLVKSLKYELAGQMLEEGRLQDALSLYKELRDYEDSAEIVEKLESYMAAEEISDLLSRYDAYVALGDFLDSAEKVAALTGDIYDEGLNLYNDENYSDAKDYFEIAGEHEKAALYLEACNIYLDASDFSRLNSRYISRLRELSDEIDVSHILVSNKFLPCWLEGEWRSNDGGGYFDFDMYSGYDFNTLPFSGSYYFMNGGMYRDLDEAPVATFTYTSYNELILTMADGTEYTFTRVS